MTVIFVISLWSSSVHTTFVNLNQSSPTFNKTIALYQLNAFNTCINNVSIQGGDSAEAAGLISYIATNYTPLPSNQIDLYVSYYNKIHNGTLKVCGD